MLSSLAAYWRPLRRRLRQRLHLGRYGRSGIEQRLEAAEHDVAALLKRLHPNIAAGHTRAPGFHDYEIRLASQHGEDGLLLHILSAAGVTDRRVVEFGIEDGRECLARTLIEYFGWSGLLMDCAAANVSDAREFYRHELGMDEDRVRVVRCLVTAENINDVLTDNRFTGRIGLLSIDIDGNDYWVWKAIDAIQPRVVVIEYNASFGPAASLVTVYDQAFDRKAKHPSGWYHGASLAALAGLADRRGYALVGCDSSGVNAFFVHRHLLRGSLPEVSVADAWRPHRSRSERATQDEQLSLLLSLPLLSDA